ncbi:MAG: hypothetical protein HN413_14000 [Chloroflexi bacterium]|jgi:hypothetical protein|nr:hypothetical protein [Chloroflexota bacterium]
MTNHLTFIAGIQHPPRIPLERYLPLIPEGVGAAWLDEHITPGGWVLDPFGASPRLLEEIARSGYRVLAAVHNPMVSFVSKILAQSPSAADLNAALAQLGAAKFRDTRLEPHIRALYQTHCHKCGRGIEAQAFLWEKDAPAPYARVYICPYCDDHGEYPTTEEDRNRAVQFSHNGLHHARALERVAPLNDPDRIFAEEALAVYPGRAVYILTTLINRLDGLMIDTLQRQRMVALILNACDRGNTLWPHPTERERPRQLTIPPKYRENNLWLALEDALSMWASTQTAIPVSQWPDFPESAGITLYNGRFKDLASELGEFPVEAIVSAIPRPNQAFWTLSALWSGWLWGADAADNFKSVLRRQRYGWRWHTVALHATFESLQHNLPAGIPIFGLLNEGDAGFISATLAAAQYAGLRFAGAAMRPEQEQARLLWYPDFDGKRSQLSEQRKQQISAQARDYLRQRGQPGNYLSLAAAGLLETPASSDDITPSEAYHALQNTLQETISYRGGFLHLDSDQTPESGYWWLADESRSQTPIADRVEMACVRFLLKNPGSSQAVIDAALCTEFTGLLTPSAELVQCCLESYGESALDHSVWSLRPQDTPATRRQDLEDMANLLKTLGTRLGADFQQLHEDPLCYQWSFNGETLRTFYLTVSALMGKITQVKKLPKPGVIVLPGGRANLVAFKIAHNPALRNTLQNDGWQFLKYRHLRYLDSNPALTLENLAEQFKLDPMTYTEPQIRLF